MSNEVFKTVNFSNNNNYNTVIAMPAAPWHSINRDLSSLTKICNYPTGSRYIYNAEIKQFNELNNCLHNYKFIEEKIKSRMQEDKECDCKYVSNFIHHYEKLINIFYTNSNRYCSRLYAYPEQYKPKEFYLKIQCNKLILHEANPQRDVQDTHYSSDNYPEDSEPSEFNSLRIIPIFFQFLEYFSFLLFYIKYKNIQLKNKNDIGN